MKRNETLKPTADYASFLDRKSQLGTNSGFEPLFMPDFLFGFQKQLAEWSITKGRAAVLAGCGLGKTPLQLVWSQNVVEKTCKPVLLLTPLAVGAQTVREGTKFGIECKQSREGKVTAPITVTNYQRLHYFNPNDFAGVAADESAVLKNFDGKTKEAVTEFMRKIKYRSLWSATPAPNDYIELGTSSEALGELGFMDMLNRFFKKAESTTSRSDEFRSGIYRFRGHAQKDFWRWVCSWARAVRKPSDLGFPDDGYILPELRTSEHIVKAVTPRDDFLFDMPAITLAEQRHERRRTINERCELAASLVVGTGKSAVSWCHLMDEGKLLRELIPGAIEVKGDDDEEFKEEMLEAFAVGQLRNLVTKPSIAAHGQNWQVCAHQTFFPSHSWEQWHQAVRRSWRFGQKHSVQIDVIASEGEAGVLRNLARKEAQAETMFARLVELINNELRIEQPNLSTKKERTPSWL